MREDSAEKSAREGLIDYARTSDSTVQRTKACGCPLAGCTVACLRERAYGDAAHNQIGFHEAVTAVELDNLP